MFKFYRYVFFKFYKWADNLNRDYEASEYTAFFSLSFLFFINVISIDQLINIIFDISIVFGSKISKFLFILIVMAPQYFLTIYRKKYLSFIKEFTEYEKTNKRKGSVLVWLYIILSLIFFFGIMYILMLINEGILS